MSCCPTNNNESISILNKTREAAVCAQTNCASATESAEAAATSAYAAAVSAGQAAASAALSGIYLGPKATAPTTDNEGNPLQEGMQYFNTTDGVLYIWNGTAWQSSAFNEFTDFTATGTTTARDLVTRMADVVNVLDFIPLAEQAAIKAGTSTYDATADIQAAIDAFNKIHIPKGTYLLSAGLTATTNHIITGEGFSNTVLNYSGSDFCLKISYQPPITNGFGVSLNLDQFCIRAKNGIRVGGTRSSHPTDVPIIGGRINVSVIGTYTQTSGDSAYNTGLIRDTTDALVSSENGTSLSAINTYNDIETYGVGLQLTKCLDTVIEYPQFHSNGISVSLIGSDLIKWRGGRSHEVGLFFYSERIGSWGSQSQLTGVDLLHNRRAGGILLNGTKFDRVDDCYYECYSNSGLMIFAENTEGALFDDNRIDDPYYIGGNGTTPIIIFNKPRWENKLRQTRFQKFTSFTVQTPPVRVVDLTAAIDTNHTEAVAIEPASGYQPLRFKEVLYGTRYGYLNKSIYTPNNIPNKFTGDLVPLAVADGDRYVFYNASSLYPGIRFDLDTIKTTYTFQVNAKTVSGTQIYFTITHVKYDGTPVSTLFASFMTGFNNLTYSNPTQVIQLVTQPTQGDFITVVWQSNTAYINGLSLE